MGIIARAIPTIAYNANIPVASFRYNNWRVILDANEITIKDIDQPGDADTVMQYLKNIVEKG
jgi:hypothetical protein